MMLEVRKKCPLNRAHIRTSKKEEEEEEKVRPDIDVL